MERKLYSWILVMVQFGAILFYVIDGPIFCSHPLLLALQIIAFGIGFWGVIAMGITKVSVFPSPTGKIPLIIKGPYRVIRHPMYSGIILMAAAMLAGRYTVLRLSVFVVLCLNQTVKLLWEEKMLKEKLEGYDSYMKKTWRLFPYIF